MRAIDLAGGDVLIVGDRDFGDVARHFRGDRELPRGDEGVVGRLEMRRVIPVDIPGARRQQKRCGADRGPNGMAAQEAAARRFTLVAVALPVLGLGLRTRPVSIRLCVGRFSRGGGPRSWAPGWSERLVLPILLASLGAGRVQKPRSMVFDIDVIQHHATPSASSGRVSEALSLLEKKRYRSVSIGHLCHAATAVKGRARSRKRELLLAPTHSIREVRPQPAPVSHAET